MTAALEVSGLTVAFGGVPALDGVDLVVCEGSFTAVLGPSGCGKTTLLRVVAGFTAPGAGAVRLAGRTVAGDGIVVPPELRGIGIVPQEGALFPHLDVTANITFGLPRAQRRSNRPRELLELLGLADLGARMPHELSGGQQQRVALARALAPRPPLVLLDEPFSALDAGLRAAVRADVRAAVAAEGATALLVTHDQEEAFAIADQIAVLRDGRVVQAGSPQGLYLSPADSQLAHFLGTAVVLDGVVEPADAVRTALGVHRLARPAAVGSRVDVLLRPERIRLGTPAASLGRSGPVGTVSTVRFTGPDTVLGVEIPGIGTITVRERDASRTVGDVLVLAVDGPVHAWPARPLQANAEHQLFDDPPPPDRGPPHR